MFEKWYERYALRLAAEKIIMAENHPQFILKIDDRKRLFWEGLLQTNFGTLYRVNILYPSSYPWQKPKLEIIDPRLRTDAPHRFVDGSLCIYPEGWNHKQCTAPAAVPLIAGWLILYEVFLRTGKKW
jgi:ubiquitin-protein ligase